MSIQNKTEAKPQNPENVGIYVRFYCKETTQNDLLKYFSQFGNVTWTHFGNNYMLLDFKENEASKKVLAKKGHFLNGKRLFVRQKMSNQIVKESTKEKKEKETFKEEALIKFHESIIAGLQGANNFDEELTRLIEKLQPNQSESFSKQNSVCRDLMHILSKKFKRIQVHPFGSTLTGLGFDCTSDIDVHLANVDHIENEEEEVLLLKVIRSILERSCKFGNTIVISTSKFPIVKSLHLSTQIPCDINIKSMFGVSNSKLIYYYMNLDPKIKRCMLALKYWAKYHEITKKALLFTNYALVMLFLFYLQDIFRFPSVHLLQQHPNLFQIDHWTAGFVPDNNFSSQTFVTSNTLDVLKGFFKYYSQFDFESHIIVPYLGQTFPRQDFASVETLPEKCDAYKTYLTSNIMPQLNLTSPLCLQDPIEHFRNITSAVKYFTLEHFKNVCKLGLKICLDTNENVLLKILTGKPVKLTAKHSLVGDCLLLQLPNTCLASVARLLDVALSEILGFTVEEDESNEFAFNCKAKIDMWSARKSTAKRLNLNKELNLIQRELKVSQHLKEENKHFSEITNNILVLKLTLEAYQDEHSEGVNISVQKLQAYKKSFKYFAYFFGSNLPLWLQAYQKYTLIS